MTTMIPNNADISFEWEENVDRALTVILGNAISNLIIHPFLADTRGSRVPKVQLTVEGELEYEWQIATAILNPGYCNEILLAHLNFEGRAIRYALLVRYFGPKGYKFYVVPRIVTASNSDADVGCFGINEAEWLQDWDQALVLLREEAMMHKMIN